MPHPIDVRPVRSRRDIRQFVDYAYVRNARDPRWIPPLRMAEFERLDPRKNPFHQHAALALFLATRDGRLVGRIAAVDDRLHNETHHDGAANFGLFEAEDADASRLLLRAVETWAAARGRRVVRGPLNLSLNESAGLLIDGFDSDPMLMMPHNPREYGGFIEAAGYGKVKDLFAWLYDLEAGVPPLISKLSERVAQKTGAVARPLNLSEFTREVERLRTIYCDAWEQNWGFVAPTAAEFARLAKELKPVFDPRCAVTVEIGGTPVACAVAVPDINQVLKGTTGRLFPPLIARLLRRARYISQARLLLLGVQRAHRALGLYPMLIHQLHRQMEGGPYKRVEFSWVLEDNRDINQPAAMAGALRYKTYRIYEKVLA